MMEVLRMRDRSDTTGPRVAIRPLAANLARFRKRVGRTSHAMANIKSQIKRNKQNEGRRLRNKAVRSELKTRVKAAVRAAEQGSDDAVARAQLAQKRMDMAAAK